MFQIKNVVENSLRIGLEDIVLPLDDAFVNKMAQFSVTVAKFFYGEV